MRLALPAEEDVLVFAGPQGDKMFPAAVDLADNERTVTMKAAASSPDGRSAPELADRLASAACFNPDRRDACT